MRYKITLEHRACVHPLYRTPGGRGDGTTDPRPQRDTPKPGISFSNGQPPLLLLLSLTHSFIMYTSALCPKSKCKIIALNDVALV